MNSHDIVTSDLGKACGGMVVTPRKLWKVLFLRLLNTINTHHATEALFGDGIGKDK